MRPILHVPGRSAATLPVAVTEVAAAAFAVSVVVVPAAAVLVGVVFVIDVVMAVVVG
jgi:hypothetical protein